DPTAALANVEATSDLEREITTAERALSQAIARAEYEVERSNAKGRKAIELFGLVFASSGLAGLLLPLPINSEVISTHPFAFATWLLLTFFGAWFVAKQRF